MYDDLLMGSLTKENSSGILRLASIRLKSMRWTWRAYSSGFRDHSLSGAKISATTSDWNKKSVLLVLLVRIYMCPWFRLGTQLRTP